VLATVFIGSVKDVSIELALTDCCVTISSQYSFWSKFVIFTIFSLNLDCSSSFSQIFLISLSYSSTTKMYGRKYPKIQNQKESGQRNKKNLGEAGRAIQIQ
jgi:hypothetical protein